MTPKHRKRVLLLFVVLIIFLTVAQAVQACECPDEDRSIPGKFESSRFVVVNRIISVNKEARVQTVYRGTEEIQEPIMKIRSVTTIVEKVYKGNLKVGDEMIFKQGGYEDCFVEFDQADFMFKADNRLSGRVLDPSGRPMPRVHLRLLPTQPNVSEYFKRDATTDADGRFEIGEIPFASYVVVINDRDKISSYQPFRRFYYPDVTDREKAQIVTIVEGVTEYPLEIHVPAAKEFVTVTGRVLTADNKPVVYAQVVFNAEKTDPTIEGSAFALTDQQGNFSLNVLKDLPGELSAVVTLEPEEFKKCPALLRVNDEIRLDRKTESIRTQADGHIEGVDFRFDFFSCNREKVNGRELRVD